MLVTYDMNGTMKKCDGLLLLILIFLITSNYSLRNVNNFISGMYIDLVLL